VIYEFLFSPNMRCILAARTASSGCVDAPSLEVLKGSLT